MSRQERIRRYVSRRVWTTNPASVAMAAVAVRLAALLDADPDRPGLSRSLNLTLRHLVDCGPGPDDVLDEIRARYCRKLLALMERPAP